MPQVPPATIPIASTFVPSPCDSGFCEGDRLTRQPPRRWRLTTVSIVHLHGIVAQLENWQTVKATNGVPKLGRPLAAPRLERVCKIHPSPNRGSVLPSARPVLFCKVFLGTHAGRSAAHTNQQAKDKLLLKQPFHWTCGRHHTCQWTCSPSPWPSSVWR